MRWNLPTPKTASQKIIDYLLEKRGLTAADREKFLAPSLEHLHDPALMPGVAQAAKVIIQAVKDKKKIFVHGDYDVDGVCATAVLWDFLYRKLGADVMPYIPNRFDDGYGVSDSSLQHIIDHGGQLVITVDCGIKDATRLLAEDIDLEFVITDHHTVPTDLPQKLDGKVKAIVHPALPGSKYPITDICGTTVAWKLVLGIARQAKIELPLEEYLDLVALATACDVMPLIDENRVIVKHGLVRMAEAGRVGLSSLLDLAEYDISTVDAYHLGYVIGPRLNAAGRLETAMDSLRLLTTNSADTAAQLALKLQNLNVQRQQLTQKLLQAAEDQIASMANKTKHYLVVGDDWPEGVVGLVAGRLAEKYHRPVFVGTKMGGIVKGSARAPSGVHLANLLKKLTHLLDKHGGHALAAGFSLAESNYDQFATELSQITEAEIADDMLEPTLHIDILMPVADADLALLAELAQLAPFGFGNNKPLWAFLNLKILAISLVGKEKSHLKLTLSDEAGHRLSCIMFSAPEELRSLTPGTMIDVAGYLDTNEWQNRVTLQMVVKDVRLAAGV